MKSTNDNSQSSGLEAAKERAAKAYSEAKDDGYKKALAFFNEPLVWAELVEQAKKNWNNETYELFAMIQTIINLTKNINSSDGDIHKKEADKIELQKILQYLKSHIGDYNLGSGQKAIIENFNLNDQHILTKMESVITKAEGGGQAICRIVGQNENSGGPPNPIFVDIKNRAEKLKANQAEAAPKETKTKLAEPPPKVETKNSTEESQSTAETKINAAKSPITEEAKNAAPPIKRSNSWLTKARKYANSLSLKESPTETLQRIKKNITFLKEQLTHNSHNDKEYKHMHAMIQGTEKDLEKVKHLLTNYDILQHELQTIATTITWKQEAEKTPNVRKTSPSKS